MSGTERILLYLVTFFTVVNFVITFTLVGAVHGLLTWATEVITNGWKYE